LLQDRIQKKTFAHRKAQIALRTPNLKKAQIALLTPNFLTRKWYTGKSEYAIYIHREKNGMIVDNG